MTAVRAAARHARQRARAGAGELGAAARSRRAIRASRVELVLIRTTRRPHAARAARRRSAARGSSSRRSRRRSRAGDDRLRRALDEGPAGAARARARARRGAARAPIRATCSSARAAGGLAALPAGARVGTASVRRRAQLLRAPRRDLDGRAAARQRRHAPRQARARASVDAIVLAAAGLARLGVDEPATRAARDGRVPAGDRAGRARARVPRRRRRDARAARRRRRPAGRRRRRRRARLPRRRRRRLQHAARRARDASHGGRVTLRALVADRDGTRSALEDAATRAARRRPTALGRDARRAPARRGGGGATAGSAR